MKNNLLNQALTYIGTSPSKSPNKGEMYYNKDLRRQSFHNNSFALASYRSNSFNLGFSFAQLY